MCVGGSNCSQRKVGIYSRESTGLGPRESLQVNIEIFFFKVLENQAEQMEPKFHIESKQ